MELHLSNVQQHIKSKSLNTLEILSVPVLMGTGGILMALSVGGAIPGSESFQFSGFTTGFLLICAGLGVARRHTGR